MKKTTAAWISIAAALCVTASQSLPAKDTFYYLGYEMVQVVDGDNDAIVANIPVDGWLRESEFSADGRFLFVVAKRHLIHRTDLAAREVTGTIDVAGGGWERFIYGFELSADGHTAYVNLHSRRTERGEAVVAAPVLAQIRMSDGEILRSVEVPWSAAALKSVQGASQMYVIGKDITIVDVSGKDMIVTGSYPMFDKGWNVLPLWDYSMENKGVFYVNYYTPEIMGLLSIDTRTGEIGDIPLDGPPVFAYSVTGSPDGKKMYAVMDELSVIDLSTRTYDHIIPIPAGTNYGINVASDGSKVYVAGGGSTITVFDAATLKSIKVLQMETDGMDLRRWVH